MRSRPAGYWFRSSLFHVEPGEDDDTNPGRYGKQLAEWLASKLCGCGYLDTDVVAEDWGWAVVCTGKPFCLFVACGNAMEAIEDDGPKRIPDDAIIWHAYASADAPLFARLRRIDVDGPIAQLDARLGELLASEPEIALIDSL
jgi:hypothetical protein